MPGNACACPLRMCPNPACRPSSRDGVSYRYEAARVCQLSKCMAMGGSPAAGQSWTFNSYPLLSAVHHDSLQAFPFLLSSTDSTCWAQSSLQSYSDAIYSTIIHAVPNVWKAFGPNGWRIPFLTKYILVLKHYTWLIEFIGHRNDEWTLYIGLIKWIPLRDQTVQRMAQFQILESFTFAVSDVYSQLAVIDYHLVSKSQRTFESRINQDHRFSYTILSTYTWWVCSE